MNPVAKQALKKLLQRAEKASAKENIDRTITVKFSDQSLPAYFTIGTHAEKEQCHGDLLLAMRHGAITIDWVRQAGDHGQVERIVLSDAIKLANFLGVIPRWDAVAAAAAKLDDHLEAFPVLSEVIEAWRHGLKPRGTSPADVSDWVDAAQVISYCKSNNALDIPVRRISTHLTNDSKRVENLSDQIDVLLQGDIRIASRSPEEVFSEIGLIKFPTTTLISGDAQILMSFDGKSQEISIPQPYIGIPPATICRFVTTGHPILLLTIENLTTFHELAATTHAIPNRILLYTGGMPSPSWKRIYQLLLEILPPGSKIMHWGDIDAGGFRIANHLAQCCADANKTLYLYMMALEKNMLSSSDVIRRALEENEITAIERICQKWGWMTEAAWVSHNRVAIEQESLSAKWPEEK